MNILVVDDEVKVASFIKKGLEAHFHTVTVVYDGIMGSKLAIERNYNLIILDLILPGMNGIEVCKEIRRVKQDIPIIMLTALDSLNDKVAGLESGADDFLTKPFHFEELIARINAWKRRGNLAVSSNVYTIADLEVDSYRKTVKRDGRNIALTAKEFILLETLIANKNKVLSRASISEAAWGVTFDRGTNLVDVYINYLRAKIDKGFSKPLIHTMIGMGYVIKEE